MKYILRTEVDENGNLVFRKIRKYNKFYYFMQSEFGVIEKVTKEKVIRKADEILNVCISGKNIYPIEIQGQEGFTREQIELAIEYVKDKNHSLSELCEELRDNEEIVMAAIQTDTFNLYYASDRLRNNKEIVFTAVSKNGNLFCLILAGEEIQKDSEFVVECIKAVSPDDCDPAFDDLRKVIMDDEELCRKLLEYYISNTKTLRCIIQRLYQSYGYIEYTYW